LPLWLQEVLVDCHLLDMPPCLDTTIVFPFEDNETFELGGSYCGNETGRVSWKLDGDCS
jgi:hypothetical protein